MMDEIDHGSYNGAQAHYRRGEKPCDACRIAKNEYQNEPNRKRRKAEMNRTRLLRKARGLAVTELVKRHNEEYRALLLEFKWQLKNPQ